MIKLGRTPRYALVHVLLIGRKENDETDYTETWSITHSDEQTARRAALFKTELYCHTIYSEARGEVEQ